MSAFQKYLVWRSQTEKDPDELFGMLELDCCLAGGVVSFSSSPAKLLRLEE